MFSTWSLCALFYKVTFFYPKSEIPAKRLIISVIRGFFGVGCRKTLEECHQFFNGFPVLVEFRGPAFSIGRVTDGKEGIDAVILRLGKGLPHQAGVEIPDPHVREARIRSREHQVGEHDGGVGLGGIDAVAFADPGFLVPAADDEDYRRPVAGMYLPEAGKGLLALDDPDAYRLAVLGRRSHAAGFQDHLQFGLGDGIIGEGVAGVAAFQDAHERIGAILVLGDFLFDVGKRGAVPDFGDGAQAT